jgi:D-beta-D-heptose 7-phosphate kinase/D-beta-D-heptose 1-phosphate adenosyltransferase
MTRGPAAFIDRFPDLPVLVVGDAMLDVWLEGVARRLCPEAPAPVVDVTGRRSMPGGAANAAANARALGAPVAFLSVVGDDAEAEILRDHLRDRRLSDEHLLTQPGRRTLAKHRVCAGGQVLVRFDHGDGGPPDAAREGELIARLWKLYPTCSAVVISDYAYGVLTPRVIAALAELQAHWPRVLVADSKRPGAFRRVGLTAAKPNYAEALQLLSMADDKGPGERAEWIAARGADVLEATGARVAAVTLDRDGAVVLERGRPPHRARARPRPTACASGAGDTFTVALALALAAGADVPAAADVAAAAASVVVGRDATTTCSAAELRAAFAAAAAAGGERLAAAAADHRRRVRLAAELAEHRRRGKRIVFTNGCFDILHRGHVAYLRRARVLGDVLVVGVNTDSGVRRLKGPTRPVNTLGDRLAVLAALSCIDHLIPFDEDTPHELIRLVKPDVFVKGGDYTRDRLPEAELVEQLGGVVRILPLVQDRSTTNLIERIRAAERPGAAPVLNGHAAP